MIFSFPSLFHSCPFRALSAWSHGDILRKPSFADGSSFFQQRSLRRNSTFSDVSRRHARLPPSHLEHLAQSAAFNSTSADVSALRNARTNLLLRATSSGESLRSRQQRSGETGGRTLQDAIDLDGDGSPGAGEAFACDGTSILQKPALIQPGSDRTSRGGDDNNPMTQANTNDVVLPAERNFDPPPSMDIQPTRWDAEHRTAEAIREVLSLREKVQATDLEIRSIQASLSLQRNKLTELTTRYNSISQDSDLTTTDKLERMGEVKTSRQGSDRVVLQLQRKLADLTNTQRSDRVELARLESKARSLDKKRRIIVTDFRDPFASWKGPLSKDSRVGGCAALHAVLGRQRGLSRSCLSQFVSKSNISRGPHPSHFLEMRKYILATQLSHAVTINAHQSCPVYCLRFDRTGRYFVTGADDYLLKVFFLGAAQSCRSRNETDGSRRLRCNYGANFRGAVLVCALRGHAGVINDIAVSTDNCFLATASVDGDVRVWGLKNGCPVAILRGHGGGANMVSWSTLTPYRLVSTGSDGFARVWDIREACLKRYGSEVGSREEYKLQLTTEERRMYDDGQQKETNSAKRFASADVLGTLPVLPDSESAAVQPEPLIDGAIPMDAVENLIHSNENNHDDARNGGIFVPPLPPAVPPLGHGADGQVHIDDDEEDIGALGPGQFVANDLIDEGVKLLLKYQHGNAQEEQQQGPGTRSRRAAINVICVARCPLGKQFATGSDDGICRVWEDYDDELVSIIDSRLSSRGSSGSSKIPMPPISGTEHKPLLKLMGHVSTITDLAYSYAGDRILSASQKDGIVRIWTVGVSAMAARTGQDAFKDKRVTQTVMKLINPASKNASQSSRRRPGSAARNPANTKVSCDVAVWTHDDSKIVTSQCVPVKQNGNEIQPGSQFLFLWDSRSGHCLIGISGAHTMQCPVVIPHPSDSSIVCTAAADGYAKVWDWGQGKCLYTHQNKVESGPPDPNSPNKIAGYLDGAFSPDGTVIVLTDDAGQITVLDCIPDQEKHSKNGESVFWMREQYFANDYYELVYDSNGYCIERGSEQPPHMAPMGARCTHSGAAYSDEINEAFRSLAGPLPLPEDACQWIREETRFKRVRRGREGMPSGDATSVRIGVREFDPLSTVIIKGSGHVEATTLSPNLWKSNMSSLAADPLRAGNTSGNSSHRNLSANYRYLDYDDLVRREGNPDEDEPDSDDEEFQPAAPNRRTVDGSEESDDDNLDDISVYSGAPRRRRNQQSAITEQRRVRANRRAQRRDNDFTEIDSDDEMIAQFVSSNRKPTGPYERDYLVAGHIWRLKSAADALRVHRRWLRREESDSSYFGRKIYTPQLGDSVVYIPRAHYETIKDFPSLQPPWQSWATGTAWPVVRCFVRGVRFRFPYEDYFRKSQTTCRSIVAILTLEVTGIPELSQDREFPWPKPSFIEPTRPFVFELSVFENSHCEYLIPESLYTSRLEALENNFRSRGMVFQGLEVDLYYDAEQRGEDAEMDIWAFSVTDLVDDDDCLSSVHLRRSGYGVVQVAGDNGYEDAASPWELNTEGADLDRPCLADDEKISVLAALNSLLETKEVAEHLSMPVDQERYSDYASMVEVAMDIMFIKRRLADNYYSCRLGVAGDLRLIRDNCVKYNTSDNEMSETAARMCTDFEQKILSDEERDQIVSEDAYNRISQEQMDGRQVPTIRIRLRSTRGQGTSETSVSTSARRYTLRDRTGAQARSALASLPAPEVGATRTRGQRDLDTRDRRGRQNARQQGRDATDLLGQVSRLRMHTLGAANDTIRGGDRRARRSNVSSYAEEDDDVSNEDIQQAVHSVRRGSRRVQEHPPNQGSSTRVISDARSLRRTARGGSTRGSPEDDGNEDNEDNGQEMSQRLTRRSTRSNDPQQGPRRLYDDDNEYDVSRQSISTGRRRTPSRSGVDPSPRHEQEQGSSAADESQGEDSLEPVGSTSRKRRSNGADSSRAATAAARRTEELDDDDDDESRDDHDDNSDVESHYSEEDDDDGSSAASESPGYDSPAPAPRKKSSREASTAPRPRPRANRNVPSGLDAASPGRRSSRAAAKQRASYHEVDSDVEMDDVSHSDAAYAAPRKRSGRRVGTRIETSFSGSDSDEEESENEIVATKRKGPKRGPSKGKKRQGKFASFERYPLVESDVPVDSPFRFHTV